MSAQRKTLGLALGALGIVYGDIGTSPLYAFRECFSGVHSIPVSRENIFGVLSLIFWSLILIVTIKYLILVMRAEAKGEGGILTLLSLAFLRSRKPSEKVKGKSLLYLNLGIFGAALLYGDGIITPSVSVLSAMEGLQVATEKLKPMVLPLTVAILIGLFSFQHIGTGQVGKIFGPIMLVWFSSIALLGLRALAHTPEVLLAFNPYYAVKFFATNHWHAFVVLGSVFLVVTGGEALYADMGHFGRKSITLAWFYLVFPALLLNYLGQGALLLRDASAASNPFYRLAPSWAILPMVGLATTAAVIASQALIAGAFSLTMQAIQLGYLPRLTVDHTSSSERGQIYMPQVNWILMVFCIAIVIGFKTSSNLAAAYGIAVTLTMLITTTLFYFAAQELWNWSPRTAALVCFPFFVLELAFFGANALKIDEGGWFPLVAGALVFTIMTTWKLGRKILSQRVQNSMLPIDIFVKNLHGHPPLRVPGTAVFLSGRMEGTPIALLHNMKHNKVLHERLILLTILTTESPYVDEEDRIEIEKVEKNFYRVVGHYGFMEEPDVPALLEKCAAKGLEIKLQQTTFFLSRETIISTPRPGMARWRERLFAILARNAQPATAFFKLPANRVVELGMQVEI